MSSRAELDTVEVTTFCRVCHAGCGLLVTVEAGAVIDVKGDPAHPASRGFTCAKGRMVGRLHDDPGRLLSCQRKQLDGSFEPIRSADAVADIARQMVRIRDRYGPDAIGAYWGTQSLLAVATQPVSLAWWRALGSHKAFSTLTVDQVAKVITTGRMGTYLGGAHRFDDADVWLLAGANPVISMAGGGRAGGFPSSADPVRRIRGAKERGLRLVVVDPRRTETAALADIHLQIRPGTDVWLLAAILKVILRDGLDDPSFWERHATGVDALVRCLDQLDLRRVAERCGIPASAIDEVAHLFGSSSKGLAAGSTGTDMGPHSNLIEHLIACLNVVCGRFNRAGDLVPDLRVLQDYPPPRAEVAPPQRTWEHGWKNRFGFGLVPGRLGGELPATILATEILEPGPDQIRALVVIGGNPVVALPNQPRVLEALNALELLVVIDPFMGATATLADYVIAPTMSLERADHTGTFIESVQPIAYGAFTPPVLPRPADLLEEWEFFWELASAMDLQIDIRGGRMDFDGDGTGPGHRVGQWTSQRPSSERLLARLAEGGPVSLDTVERHPHGFAPARTDVKVLDANPDNPHHRLQLFPSDVAAEMSSALAELSDADVDDIYPWLLITRRLRSVYNSTGQEIEQLAERARFGLFIHPSDAEALELDDGDAVTVRSMHGELHTTVVCDTTLRLGVVAMSHCWGGREPGLGVGANTGRLSADLASEQVGGNMPQLTSIPVQIVAVGDADERR